MDEITYCTVPYDIAVKLKELNFHEKCFSYYKDKEQMIDLRANFRNPMAKPSAIVKKTNHDFKNKPLTAAPTWDTVLKWFREKGLIGMLSTEDSKYIYYIEDSIERVCFSEQKYDSYEIARKELVKELIEIFANVSNNL